MHNTRHTTHDTQCTIQPSELTRDAAISGQASRSTASHRTAFPRTRVSTGRSELDVAMGFVRMYVHVCYIRTVLWYGSHVQSRRVRPKHYQTPACSRNRRPLVSSGAPGGAVWLAPNAGPLVRSMSTCNRRRITTRMRFAAQLCGTALRGRRTGVCLYCAVQRAIAGLPHLLQLWRRGRRLVSTRQHPPAPAARTTSKKSQVGRQRNFNLRPDQVDGVQWPAPKMAVDARSTNWHATFLGGGGDCQRRS